MARNLPCRPAIPNVAKGCLRSRSDLGLLGASAVSLPIRRRCGIVRSGRHYPAYDEAVALLVRLRDLAAFQDRLPDFQARIAALQTQYAGRPAFQARLGKAGLI
jgi:hypothetical protein